MLLCHQAQLPVPREIKTKKSQQLLKKNLLFFENVDYILVTLSVFPYNQGN